jgi:tRNA modification GTPase
VAIATPPGRGGIGVIRVSGPAAGQIAAAILGERPHPRRAVYREFVDEQNNAIDQGIALYFPAPRSFTGEDVLELHGHGGPVVLDLLLQRLVTLGARLARPGEFSERAFLNGKLDLAQAEAVADLIESGTTAAARAAVRSLQGEFSRRVHEIVDGLIALRTYVEAAIDFPDEEVELLDEKKIGAELKALSGALAALMESAHQGSLLRDGMTVVLAGRPNAGKSSLLNALAGRDAAIVSAIPGTTRDLLHEHLHVDGMPLHVIDTAGLRDCPDEIESEGMRRAKLAMARADRILLVIDDAVSEDFAEDAAILAHLPSELERTVVRNKIDLTGRVPGAGRDRYGAEIAVSAKTGAGLDDLCAHLKCCVGYRAAGEGEFTARRRHLDAIHRTRSHVEAALEQSTGARAGELMAEELRLAQLALAEITGEFSSEDLLGRIFSTFCIGK